MHIDRSRFLLLTASMAGACSSTAPDAAAPMPVISGDPLAGAQPIVVAAPPSQWAPDESAPPPARKRVYQETIDEPGADNLARCQTLKPPPAPQCEGFGYVRAQCEAYDRALTPDAAAAATDCLVARSGSAELCNDDIVGRCLVAGLQTVRPRKVPEVDCDGIVNSCGHSSPLTMSSCRRAAAGVKPQHRDDLVACMVESCRLEECIYYF